jgi:hypothetical protein
MSDDESDSGENSGDVQTIGMDAGNEETVLHAEDLEGVHKEPEAILNHIEEAVDQIGINSPTGRFEREKAEGMKEAVDQVKTIIDQMRQRQQ